jgi:glycosyltransferase involved in cell wall biosynthesis
MAASARDPWLINDYALARHYLGESSAALDLLRSLGSDDRLPSAVVLNRFYMEASFSILSSFDSSWAKSESDSGSHYCAPRVSVIVRTFNRPDLLGEALASLKAQTFSDFEVIVVNDGGDPAAEDVVKKAGLGCVRYAMLPHGGRVRALNAGLALARGGYITGLDDDDAAYPCHLEKLAGYLDSPGAAPVVYGDYCLATYGRGAGGAVSRREVRAGAYRRGALFETNPCTILLMARRECYESAGCFIPALELAEDWEMWLRLASRYDFHHLAEVTAEVRERPGSANLTSRRLVEKYYWDNLVLYMRRGLGVFSFPKRPELESGYGRALGLVDRLLAAHPAAKTRLNLRGLWDMKRPYSWFADQGRWFLQLGEAGMARTCYALAARLGPLEPKAWSGIIKSIASKSARSDRGE